jgi:hypothetical protein
VPALALFSSGSSQELISGDVLDNLAGGNRIESAQHRYIELLKKPLKIKLEKAILLIGGLNF